jgi:4-alpha-glucanotransferase
VGSLPSGRMGREALAFVDWLADAGQSWWQILPLQPPDRHGSPYAGQSAFAGSPALLAAPRARVTRAEESDFRGRHAYWVEDWIRAAGPEALADQVRFEREWGAVRAHAAARGVRILGDIPFYVAPGAADVAAHPALFRSDAVAGVPPDAFTADGQLWGNPPYDWGAMAADGDRWWIRRLERSRELHDAARIDHFRAFVAWWGVSPRARTARHGSWRPGPKDRVIVAARRELGPLALVAEDLGVITDPVRDLMERLGLPGMRVLQFAHPGGPANPHRPENHPVRSVAYFGTHDNDTAIGWWRSADEEQRRALRADGEAAGIREKRPERLMTRLTQSSRAGLAILMAQDLLGLGSEARLNTPGTSDGNWRWRLAPGALTADLAARLRDDTEAAGRLP